MTTLTVTTANTLTSVFNSKTQTFKKGDRICIYDALTCNFVREATIINLGGSFCLVQDTDGRYFENNLRSSKKIS
jgi:hypothetical protein